MTSLALRHLLAAALVAGSAGAIAQTMPAHPQADVPPADASQPSSSQNSSGSAPDQMQNAGSSPAGEVNPAPTRDDQDQAAAAPHHRGAHHRAGQMQAHGESTPQEMRQTAALNALAANGYNDVKDLRIDGDNVQATAAKDGKSETVQVDLSGNVKPMS